MDPYTTDQLSWSGVHHTPTCGLVALDHKNLADINVHRHRPWYYHNYYNSNNSYPAFMNPIYWFQKLNFVH